MIIPAKTCTKCGAEKPATTEYFHKHLGCKYGVCSTCKPCASARCKAWNEANVEKRKVATKAWYEANSEKQNAASKAWREANPEKLKANSKAWYEANRAKDNAATKNWRLANPEKSNANSKAWREANPEKRKAVTRKWCLANPEKVLVSAKNRRARKRNAEGSFTAAEWQAKLELYKGHCHWCGKKIKGAMHADHVIPLSKGGSNYIANLVPACAKCNLTKSAKTPLEFAGRLF